MNTMEASEQRVTRSGLGFLFGRDWEPRQQVLQSRWETMVAHPVVVSTGGHAEPSVWTQLEG